MRAFRSCLLGLTALFVGWSAYSQISLLDPFEDPPYSLGILTGQNDWYTITGSSNWFVGSYANPPYGLSIPVNPNGGGQMIHARMDTQAAYPRAQKNFSWNTRDKWLISYDVLVSFDQSVTFPNQNFNNIGSFSLQPSLADTRYMIDLFTWASPAGDVQEGNPQAGWVMSYGLFAPEQPTTLVVISFVQGTPFHGLQINRWYRRYFAIDFTENRLVKIGIRDLETGQTYTYLPVPVPGADYWYLNGGPNPNDAGVAQLPTAYRFFVGGGTGANFGNVLMVDNLTFTAFSPADVNLDGCVDDADLLAVLFDFGNQQNFLPTDVNGDGTVDDADLLAVLFDFGSGC